MACHTALRIASAASSGSSPTARRDPAGEGMKVRCNTRTDPHDATAKWTWIGIAVALAVAAVVYGYAP